MQDKYSFTIINGRVTTVTEYNTRILWLRPDGRVLVGRTLKSRFKYWWHSKTALVRQYHMYKDATTRNRFSALR
jgi:hypothetical protein